jgi:hypothetical protein
MIVSGSGQYCPSKIAIDLVNVYWTDGHGTIMKAPLDRGTPTMLAAGVMALYFGVPRRVQ